MLRKLHVSKSPYSSETLYLVLLFVVTPRKFLEASKVFIIISLSETFALRMTRCFYKLCTPYILLSYEGTHTEMFQEIVRIRML